MHLACPVLQFWLASLTDHYLLLVDASAQLVLIAALITYLLAAAHWFKQYLAGADKLCLPLTILLAAKNRFFVQVLV